MPTTEENFEKISGYLGRIADAVERIASSLEPAETDDDPRTIADDLQIIANCVSSEDGNGLCEAISRAANKIVSVKKAE
jgi:hypothetical protein